MMKRIVCVVLSLFLVLSAFCGSAQAASASSSPALISTALSQLDYEEGAKGFSKYGQWYGVPNGDWCDMFVSWCANQAGIPTSVFPRSSGCTTHVRLFNNRGVYYVSQARGGTYTPKQGDLIFFYSYPEHPDADVVRHVGIVLCVENGYVFTIEGNTLTNRLDYPYYESIDPLRQTKLEPNDYAAVKRYPLDEPQIHGYASPNYSDRSVFVHNGWVDLGKYESLRTAFETLAALDIMPETSSYTFSPRYGMTRGEFLTAILKLYGLYGWDAETKPFDDVPESSACYGAAMTARSAGIVLGTGSNRFLPDIYISGKEAQAIISRVLAYVGREDQTFDFSEGDFSYLLTPYTIRADIAKALYALLSDMSETVGSSDKVLFNGELLDYSMLKVDGYNYVPVEMLEQIAAMMAAAPDGEDGTDAEGPEQEPGSGPDDCEEAGPDAGAEAGPDADAEAGPDADAEAGPDADAEAEPDADAEAEPDADAENEPDDDADAEPDDDTGAEPPVDPPVHLPVPMDNTNRVFLSSIQLQNGDRFADVPAFIYHGIQYVMLRPAADLFRIDAQWNGESRTVELVQQLNDAE